MFVEESARGQHDVDMEQDYGGFEVSATTSSRTLPGGKGPADRIVLCRTLEEKLNCGTTFDEAAAKMAGLLMELDTAFGSLYRESFAAQCPSSGVPPKSDPPSSDLLPVPVQAALVFLATEVSWDDAVAPLCSFWAAGASSVP